MVLPFTPVQFATPGPDSKTALADLQTLVKDAKKFIDDPKFAENFHEDFGKAIDEWNKHHESRSLQIELSGPWPLYHFAPAL